MLQQAIFSNIIDYYPFGMVAPGRSYSAASGYRYGFNSYEVTNEIYGNNNFIDFGERMFEPRLSRFISIDPLQMKYPWQSVYVFAENNPIVLIDERGMGADDPKEVRATASTQNVRNTTMIAFDWKTNTEKLENPNYWNDGTRYYGPQPEPELKMNITTSTSTSSLIYKFPTAASINKWNDQHDESNDNAGTIAGLTATTIGLVFEINPILDAAIGVLVDELVDNSGELNKVNFNPGYSIVVESSIKTIRSTSTRTNTNGISYSAQVKVVDAEGVVVFQRNGASGFLSLDPNTYEEHNTMMKSFELGQNNQTTITNPNYNPLIDFKFIRTN